MATGGLAHCRLPSVIPLLDEEVAQPYRCLQESLYGQSPEKPLNLFLNLSTAWKSLRRFGGPEQGAQVLP
jgi:hypothetical protein